MQAFVVTWRALRSFYDELFLLLGMCVLWVVTGGIFFGLAFILGWPLVQVNGPWWMIPLLAIPAGPATAAMANVVSRVARELRVDRSFFWEGWRAYWKPALAVNAVSLTILSLLLLNLLFYGSQTSMIRLVALLWLYLVLFWVGMQLYLFPALVALKEPTIVNTLRTAAVLAFANPLHTIIVVAITGALTVLSIGIPILVVVAWPAVIGLLGEYSFRSFVERMNQAAAERDAKAGKTTTSKDAAGEDVADRREG